MATAIVSLPRKPGFITAVTGDTAINYDSMDLRYILHAMYPKEGKIGVFDSCNVYQSATPGWTVDVLSGQAMVHGSTTMEKYLVTVPTRTTISLTGFNTSPAATRTHRVFLMVDDKNTSGTLYGGRIMVTEDVGSGAPVPTGTDTAFYLELGTVQISPSQTSITNANISQVGSRGSNSYAPTSLSMSTGYSLATIPAKYSVAGGVVSFQGGVVMTSGANFGAPGNHNFATLPAAASPSATRIMTGGTAGGTVANYTYRLQVSTNGVMMATLATGNTPGFLYLDGVSFQI